MTTAHTEEGGGREGRVEERRWGMDVWRAEMGRLRPRFLPREHAHTSTDTRTHARLGRRARRKKAGAWKTKLTCGMGRTRASSKEGSGEK